MTALDKVRRNIRLLRDQIFPVETRGSPIKEIETEVPSTLEEWEARGTWHTCDDCGESKLCLYVADPFLLDVRGITVPKWMCFDCYEQAEKEI